MYMTYIYIYIDMHTHTHIRIHESSAYFHYSTLNAEMQAISPVLLEIPQDAELLLFRHL